MSLTEFDQEAYDRYRRAEGYMEGEARGMQQKALETASKMKQDNLSYEMIAKYTSLSKEEILAL